VLRLELPLLERPGRLPAENDGRRGDEGSIGDGDAGGGEGTDEAPSSIDGMSVWDVSEQEPGGADGTYHPQLRPIQHCSVRRVSLAL
jgi:hypothetical protein